MKNPVYKTDDYKISIADIRNIEKLLNRPATQLEKTIFAIIYKSVDHFNAHNPAYAYHGFQLNENEYILPFIETFDISNINKDELYCLNTSLLQFAIKKYSPLIQTLSIHIDTEKRDQINNYCKDVSIIKSTSGVVSVVDIVKCKPHFNIPLSIGQYTIAYTVKEKALNNKLKEGLEVICIEFKDDYEDTLLKKAGIKTNHNDLKTLPSYVKQMMLTECVSELAEIKDIQFAFIDTKTGMLLPVMQLCQENNCGIHLKYEKQDCQDSEGMIPAHFIPGTDVSLILVYQKKYIEDIEKIVNKWELHYTPVGNIINDNKIIVEIDEKKEAILPTGILPEVNQTKGHQTAQRQPQPLFPIENIDEPGDMTTIVKKMMNSPNIASKTYFKQQFDYMAGSHYMNIQTEARIVKLPTSNILLCSSMDITQIEINHNIEIQVYIAISRCIKKIICSGGIPKMLNIHCHDADIYENLYSLHENISKLFNLEAIKPKYNKKKHESLKNIITIGMSGIIPSVDNITNINFKSKGDMIYIIGDPINDIGSSEYLSFFHHNNSTHPAYYDIDFDTKLTYALQEVIQERIVNSAHSIGRGGLFTALVESSLEKNLGFDITCPAEVRTDAFLFGESPLLVLVSLNEKNETLFIDKLMGENIPFSTLGHVTREELRIDDTSLGFILDYKSRYNNQLAEYFNT